MIKGHSKHLMGIGCSAMMVSVWFSLTCCSQPSTSILPIGELRTGRPVTGMPYDIRPTKTGKTIRVQGLIHQKLLWPGSRPDRPNHAFLIQNLPEHADGKTRTSDGLLVFTGKSMIPRENRGADYLPKVGDWVVLEGRLQHRYGQTELDRPRLIRLIKQGMNPASALPLIELKPKSVRGQTLPYMEQLEGMRVVLPPGAFVVAGRQVIGNHTESYSWIIPSSDPVAKRSQPFQNRVFRDPHPLDDIPDKLFDNDNGTRILLGTHGIKAMTGRPDALLPALCVGDRFTKAVVGGVIYSYSQYKVMPIQSPEFVRGLDPSDNIIPSGTDAFNTESGFRVVTYNVENLYDFRDDPSDPCDAADDPGNKTIQPPFNYLPKNEKTYRNRLKGLAWNILHDLKLPDLIMVQELEDQDILTLGANVRTPVKSGSDGKPDVLQELSRVIQSIGGPRYEASLNRKGCDTRGIICGFLYRSDKVTPKPLGKVDKWLNIVRQTFPKAEIHGNPSESGSVVFQSARPKPDSDGSSVYARPPQMARFEVLGGGQQAPMQWIVINAHFASRPNVRVNLRKDQARLAAAVAKALLQAEPDVGILIGGDLNVFPRPDDPFSQAPSDQLAALYEIGAESAYDWVLTRKPENAYSYVYNGQAQTLDHLFMLGKAKDRFQSATFLHINSDWPEGVPISLDAPRGISDHDPLIVNFQ